MAAVLHSGHIAADERRVHPKRPRKEPKSFVALYGWRQNLDERLRLLPCAIELFIHLDLMDGYLKAVQLPLHERREAVEAVEAKLQSTSKVHVLLHEIAPALARITTLETRVIAHLRTAQVALAIQRYRLAAGALPDKLAALAPAYLETVPKDPFDGNNLRYRKLDAGGFVVYSIGEDLSDDGGKEKPRKSIGGKLPNWDVTFIVER